MEYIKEFLERPIGEYLIECRKTGTAVAMINPKDLTEVPIVDRNSEEQNKIIRIDRKGKNFKEGEGGITI